MALTTPMYTAKPNSPQTTLAADIAADTTTIVLADASVLPPAPNLATIGTDQNAEVIYYGSLSGNTISDILRGQSGTTASAWGSGAPVARYFTSYDYEAFRSNIQELDTNLGGKQDTLTFDSTPTANSNNPVTSGGIKTALNGKQNTLTFDTTPTASSSNPVTSGGIYTAIHGRALHISMPSTSTLGQISNPAITTTMRVVNIVWGTPSNVTSNVSWNTNTAEKLILSGTLSGPTTAEIDLIDFG